MDAQQGDEQVVTGNEIPGSESATDAGEAFAGAKDDASDTSKGQKPAEAGDASTDEQKNTQAMEEARRKAAERDARRVASINQRFAELTAEKKAAEKLAAELMEIVKKQSGSATAGKDEPSGEPRRDQFETYEDYLVAKAHHTATQAAQRLLEESRERMAKESQASAHVESERQAVQRYTESYKRAASEIADFNEVMATADVQVPTNVGRMIRLLDNGAVVAYHLAKNPEVAARFSTSPPELHGVILGEISAAVKAPKAQASNAPQPAKVVPSAKTASSGDDTPPEDADAYMRWAEKHMR